jgi:murein DD-endopeptidase MepM/ murein hydrolase activator NlpD
VIPVRKTMARRHASHVVASLIQVVLMLSALLGCERHSAPGSFIFPLDEYVVFQEFCNMNARYERRYHTGEDANGNGGTPVRAVADGSVSYSGTAGGYGWLIVIDHPGSDVYSLYGHLSTRREKVSSGERVRRGQVIGYIAYNDEDGSGQGYPEWGPHLHFAIRKGSRGDYPESGDERWEAGYTSAYPPDIGWVDPTDFIKMRSR